MISRAESRPMAIEEAREHWERINRCNQRPCQAKEYRMEEYRDISQDEFDSYHSQTMMDRVRRAEI